MRRAACLGLLLALHGPVPAIAAGEIALPLSAAAVPSEGRLETIWHWGVGAARLIPAALDVHPSGLVWGIEARRHRLFRCSLDGSDLEFAAGGEGPVELGFASHVFARSGLSVFTLDPWNQWIERYDLAGVREGRLDLAAILEQAGESLIDPVDFCLRRSGELFVLDREAGRILAFDEEGRFGGTIGELGAQALRDPLALDVDGHGRLYVLEADPPELLILELAAKRFTHRPLDAEGDWVPVSLAIDPWGTAFIGDASTGRIRVEPHTGEVGWWLDVSADGLTPSDLAADGVRLLVGDRDARQVWVFLLTYQRRESPRDGASGSR
ncbi:MAG: hypothetical protein KAY32_10285 [Candidatus Eisenbacteria sp.]|nr:hypothetical protein [Candidatus Eisenbacteria bacterium]